MKIETLALSELVDRLENREPFRLVRYGDGEWLSILGRRPGTQWGRGYHEIDLPGLADGLRRAVRQMKPGDGLYACTSTPRDNPVVARRGMWPDIRDWIRANAPGVTWYDTSFFRHAAEGGRLLPFIEAIREARLGIVGGPHLRLGLDVLGAEEYVEIPSHNCFSEYDAIFDETKTLDVDVITFSAAMMSEVIIPELWDEFSGETTLIDVGSLWDPFCGKFSRSFHAEMDLYGLVQQRTRSIVVLCLPRSGSSAVAGALQRLGIEMGETQQRPRDRLNPRGYYEDHRWQRIIKAAVGLRYTAEPVDSIPERHRASYARLTTLLNRTQTAWGVKIPRMCFVLPYIRELFEDLRIVVVRRSREANIRSLVRHSEFAYADLELDHTAAQDLLSRWNRALQWSLANVDVPTYEIRYEALVSDTAEQIERLVDFVYADSPLRATPAQIKRACQFVNPELQHFEGRWSKS